jgi:predicted nucleotide-binding protein (sugar kinase/HSP70/actin superfamily)
MKETLHYRRPAELPFTSEEQQHVTIILGGLTWKHERLIQSVLQRHGHRVECLPAPDRKAHEIGSEYCSNGLCNPAYFTAGSLILRLRELEAQGLSREEIVRRYVYLTAGSGGPCRFGMYESEIRSALHSAGYSGFRIVLFLQEQGVKAESGQTGLRFSVDVGMSVLHAFILGDLLNDLQHKIRAYEAKPGDADRLIASLVDELAEYFRTESHFDLAGSAPEPLRNFLQSHRQNRLFRIANTLCKVSWHLKGNSLQQELAKCREMIASVEVDRLRLKPLVKVIGEFWAQTTEGDGNFRMFEFLEREGAEVAVESISCWILYLLFQSRQRIRMQRRLACYEHPWSKPMRAARVRAKLTQKQALFGMAERIYVKLYKKLGRALGGITSQLVPQRKLAELAAPHFNTQLHGGEGHLEVAKNLYYSTERRSHMVLALKPFGCLPSQQSDAVQASLVERNPDMIFASIETAGDGEIHAYSRVQMALADARVRARDELASVLRSTRLSMDQVREFLAAHPEMASILHPVSRRDGVASVAANLVLDVSERMRATPGPTGPGTRRRDIAGAAANTSSHQEA